MNILAVRRNGAFIVSPGADFMFQSGDVVVMLGDNLAVKAVQRL